MKRDQRLGGRFGFLWNSIERSSLKCLFPRLDKDGPAHVTWWLTVLWRHQLRKLLCIENKSTCLCLPYDKLLRYMQLVSKKRPAETWYVIPEAALDNFTTRTFPPNR